MKIDAAGDAELIDRFEDHLRGYVERTSRVNPVYRQIAYHLGYVGAGPARHGKRLRPRFVLAASASCGGSPEAALPACAAVELLHNYSLIHDDIEDGDKVRHGRETVWSAYGLAHGVNAGDALGALSLLALSPVAAEIGPHAAFAMAVDLATANKRMCEGQALDIAFETGEHATVETYLDMIGGKTAALFGCAGSLGARCARGKASDIERCAEIGRMYGLAFQIQDDVFGIWGDMRETGKSADGDLARRKKSYPVVWAMEHDASGAGAKLTDAFGRPGAVLDAPTVEGLRAELERAGARAAAVAAADDCYARAVTRAAGLPALEAFLHSWRIRRY